MTTVTHYKSSKGPVEIATMPLRYASNALGKLRRDEPDRMGEIAALSAHVAAIEARDGDDAAPQPVAGIGDNHPPVEITGAPASDATWDAIKAHLDDLLTEAANWADGAVIASQAQCDAAARLRQQLQAGASAADAARMAEKRVLDEQIAAIQDRYNAYIAPLKNRSPGTVSKAIAALGNLITGWLAGIEAEKREREREAAAAAAKAAADALAARAEAKAGTDLAAFDTADSKLAEAEALIRQAKGVAREKVHAAGETRAVGLRSYWRGELITGQGQATLNHYLKVKPERIRAFLQSLVDEDVRAGARAIPGCTITEERRVA